MDPEEIAFVLKEFVDDHWHLFLAELERHGYGEAEAAEIRQQLDDGQMFD